MAARDLRTIKQVAAERQGFTESALRGLVFRAPSNGLEPSLVKIGRRVLIDLERFDEWLESNRLCTAAALLERQTNGMSPGARTAHRGGA